MRFSFFQILVIIILAYTVLPTLLIRFMRIGAISRAPKGGGRIALTFDDGPDPRYTPQILDLLKRYQVKACFFVVGAKARAHPDLIRRIVQDGHEVGNHGFKHKAAWLLGPRATTREIKETNQTLEELTGKKTRFCRPAWGLFNLFSVWYCWLKDQKVVLWTFMSWDWIKKATPESIAYRVINRIRDGAILIFHDSDSTIGAAEGSPARVVAALPQILDGLRHKGLRVVPLEEIVAKKTHGKKLRHIARWLWSKFDSLIRRLAGIRELEDGGAIWRIARRRFRGKDWRLPDGSLLRAGEYYLELHINNDRLLSLIKDNTSVEQMAITAMREVRKGLPELVKLLNCNKQFSEVKVLIGITLLHRGLVRIGFSVVDMKAGLFHTLTCWYEKMLLAFYHPGGFKNLKAYRNKLTPKYVVMTRQELMRRYPPVEE